MKIHAMQSYPGTEVELARFTSDKILSNAPLNLIPLTLKPERSFSCESSFGTFLRCWFLLMYLLNQPHVCQETFQMTRLTPTAASALGAWESHIMLQPQKLP